LAGRQADTLTHICRSSTTLCCDWTRSFVTKGLVPVYPQDVSLIYTHHRTRIPVSSIEKGFTNNLCYWQLQTNHSRKWVTVPTAKNQPI